MEESSMPNRPVTAAAAVVALLSAAVAPARSEPVKNVVLVHGAFADGSGWRRVGDILSKDGYTVTVVQEPLTSLADDVAATKRVLDVQQGPTLLVGHSYGGVVITEAGNAPVVAGLVYIAAFIPDQGESAVGLLSQAPAANNDMRATETRRIHADGIRLSLPFRHAKVVQRDAGSDDGRARGRSGRKYHDDPRHASCGEARRFQ
jgi:pimeloyl-ACP methyl ester carboxylesterase